MSNPSSPAQCRYNPLAGGYTDIHIDKRARRVVGGTDFLPHDTLQPGNTGRTRELEPCRVPCLAGCGVFEALLLTGFSPSLTTCSTSCWQVRCELSKDKPFHHSMKPHHSLFPSKGVHILDFFVFLGGEECE